jgi:uncharacterized membrane-anchored protein YitT (DUF2179 family)
MSKFTLKSTLKMWKQLLWNLFIIALGCELCAVAINGILIPRQFLSGGFTGVALAIHYLVPSWPVAVYYFILNIPVFALGWVYVGRRFFLYSIAGMVMFSAALALTKITLPVYDKILSALLAGIISGVGSGLILRSLGSAGGLDILSVILLRLFSVRLGTSVLAFNVVILAAAGILFSLEGALYTMIYMYVTSYILNLVVTGLSQRKAVLIISPQWDRISKDIMENIERGVTITKAQGAYTGSELHALYTVISFQELPRVKAIIRKIDPDAFVVVTDTLEVMGRRIGNQPHW